MKNYTIVAAFAALNSKRKIESLGMARVTCKKQYAVIPLFVVDGKTLGDKCIKLHKLVDSLFHNVVTNKREGALNKVGKDNGKVQQRHKVRADA